MLEQNAQPTAGNCFQDSQCGPAEVLIAGSLGGGLVPAKMRFGGRMPGTELALLLRLSSAHGAADRQYLSRREFHPIHTKYYSTTPGRKMVNLARWLLTATEMGSRAEGVKGRRVVPQ